MVVRELVNIIGWKVDSQQLKNAEKKSMKFLNTLKNAGIIVGASIIAIGTAAINAASNMEMLTTQFAVMLGSTEKAVLLMDELKKFAAATPFSLNDLAKGTQNLLAFGVAQEDVMTILRMLGDTAGGNTEKLQSLILAYGKVQAKGKVSMEEINMMAERGVPIIETLRKQLGVTEEQFFKLVSAGKIGREEITQAFRTMTSEGGIFYKGMETASQTFAGLISTMKDNISLLLAEIGTKLLPTLKKIVIEITNLFQGSLGGMIDEILKTATPLLDNIFQITKTVLDAILPIIPLLLDLLKPVLNLVQIIANSITPVLQSLTNILKPILSILSVIITIATNIMSTLSNSLGSISQSLEKILVPLLELAADIFSILGESIDDIIASLARTFVPLLEVIADLFAEIIPTISPIIKILATVLSFIIKLSTLSHELFFGTWIKGAALFLKLLQPIIQLLKFVFVPLFELINKIITKINDFITSIMEKVVMGISDVIIFLIETINKAVIAINKLPFVKKKLSPIDSDEILRNIRTETKRSENKVTNFQMQNEFNFNGGNMDATNIKRNVQQAVGTPFQIEIKKIIADI